jgi:hypothetical protein
MFITPLSPPAAAGGAYFELLTHPPPRVGLGNQHDARVPPRCQINCHPYKYANTTARSPTVIHT